MNKLAMDLTAAFHPDLPLHFQVTEFLRREISNGRWSGLACFPGEVEIANWLGVSVITVRRALDKLRSEKLIVRTRGRGTRVLNVPEEVEPINNTGLDEFVSQNDRFKFQVISAEEATPPPDASHAYGEDVGVKFWVCTRLRQRNGELHSVAINVQRPEIGRRHAADDLRTRSMVLLLQRKCGVEISKIRRILTVDAAPLEIAHYLGVYFQHPVMVMTCISEDRNGEVVDWVRIYIPRAQARFEDSLSAKTIRE
jgi:GntR family transcriptional regulator